MSKITTLALMYVAFIYGGRVGSARAAFKIASLLDTETNEKLIKDFEAKYLKK